MSWLKSFKKWKLRSSVTEKSAQPFPYRTDVFLSSVVENIPNMIFVKDAKDLKFIRFNRAGEELIGQSRDNLIGKNDYDFFPKEQADAFTKKDRDVLSGGVVVDIPEEPISTARGVRYLHTKKIPLFNDQGEPAYLLGISEDITEKILAEKQRLKLLQEQVARVEAEKVAERLGLLAEVGSALTRSLDYKKTIDTFGQIMISKMCEWCIIDIQNETDGRIHSTVAFRDPDKAHRVQSLRERLPSEKTSQGLIAKVMTSGEPLLLGSDADEFKKFLQEDLRIEEEDLRDLNSATIVPFRSYDKVIGTLTLISRKNIRDFNDLDYSIAQDLARRAASAIENARLYQKSLEASRVKTAFLANMSHEVRTPLAAVLGFAQVMKEDSVVSNDDQERLSLIIKNGKQLLGIVDEILDISKIESDRMDLEFIPFKLRALLQEVCDLFKIQIQNKNLELTCSVDDEVSDDLRTDPTRLRQILINILGNAIKFTKVGGVHLHVKMHPAQDRSLNRVISFLIRDTGIGISKEQAQALFQPFTQADSSTTRKFGGTGLGLFLSKKLAQKLGGDLSLAESRVGLGSSFLLTTQVSVVTPSLKVESVLPRTKTAPSKPISEGDRKGTVLVVDDYEDNRVLVKWFLNHAGYDVDMAESGKEGVSKALSGDYDLVLMDIQMPGMDGFEALKKLKARQYSKPVVALTAHAMKGDKEHCLSSGFDDYLIKPINQEDLEKMLERF